MLLLKVLVYVKISTLLTKESDENKKCYWLNTDSTLDHAQFV